MSEVYASLAAHFDVHHKDPRGLDYLTGNQVVGRLNEVLGFEGWSFSVKEHGFDAQADEVWALGRLEVYPDAAAAVTVIREQFGSQKHNRRRAPVGEVGAILDYGFDLKGAATDALKKCASLIGVGLYLREKEGGILQEQPAARAPTRPAPTADPGRKIDSHDDDLVQKYAGLTERAAELEVPFEVLQFPITEGALRRIAEKLKAAIKAKKQTAEATA